MGRAFEFRKARKMKRWSTMSKAFTKLGKEIVMAVKEGGPDPDANSRLRAIIQNAKAINMPKDNIERAIKKANNKNTSNYKEVIIEGYAPFGIAILLETATDNNNRTISNIRACFNKYNGSLGTSGSVIFMFEHTCSFNLKKESVKTFSTEELELELVNFDVEGFFEDEKEITVYAPFKQFGSLQSFFEKYEIEILSSNFERTPNATKKLTDDQKADVEKLLESLENDDDVQNVYHTMEI